MPNPNSVAERGAGSSTRPHGHTPITKGALPFSTSLSFLCLVAALSGCGAGEGKGAAVEGGADDLGPPISRGLIKIGGQYVLSCPALERERPATTYYAEFQAFCDGQNGRMKADGFPSCKPGYCAETWTSNRGDNQHSLVLKLAQTWPDSSWKVSISFETRLGPGVGNGERLVCRPAAEMWESSLWKARESWSFERYLELCSG